MRSKSLFTLLAVTALGILAIALLVALPGVSADGDEDKKKDTDQGQEQALPIPEKANLKYPTLGSRLDQLVVSVEEEKTTAEEAAADTPVHREESVAVTIYLSGNVDDVAAFLEDNGGDPRNVGEDYIEAYVPVSLLGPVSEQPGVIRVREIVPPEPGQSAQRVAGHGPAAHLSAAWSQAGYTGLGVKVGVIDSHPAFNGFSDLMGTELPSTVQARCYTDIGRSTTNLADCEDAETGGNHGTLVAEAVVDIAPEVSLYIANPQSLGDIRKAVDWMVSEGVKVIVQPETYVFDGPGDGNSPFSDSPLRTVDRAVAGGVVWVNSAGNDARRTWFARSPFLDGDGDGVIEFSVRDEINFMSLEAGDVIRVQLRWDDKWGGAARDLDLYITDNTGRILPGLRGGKDPQSGADGHYPFEFIAIRALRDGQFGLAVERHSGTAPDWIQMMVWGVPEIEHYTRNGSIGNPAESANEGMLAVGAAHWDDVRAIEPYSSRGPTPGPAPDGREKPDIVGADCGATALVPLNEYNSGFCGTSQAAPHVAGLAALVRQRFPDYTPAQVAGYLKDNAEQRQSPDPNSTWGHGFAQLPPPEGATRPTAPTLSNAFTRNPAADFNTLADTSSRALGGIWSDGTTMWVADWIDDKIYAYDMATKAYIPGRDFDTLAAVGGIWPGLIWSDGTTMYVAAALAGKIYAYDMATRARVPGKDFDTLQAAGNWSPGGIWSDGTTMWVADWIDDKIYAYDMATKARVPGKDFDSLNARNQDPEGIWSDGTTMWVADDDIKKIYAYDMATKARVPDKEFNTLEAAGHSALRGIWSDGTTMWVSDWLDEKLYAYHMPQAASSPDREELVALYRATDGANWTNKGNWLSNAPIGQWHGVITDSNGRVTELDLSENRLSGNIPAQLGNLANLTHLRLHRNGLTGTIPTELGGLSNLEILNLGGNRLTGTIPTQLGNLADLRGLYLWGNEFTGPVPAWLGSLANLQWLYLSDNQLRGTIPTELGSPANLQVLSLSRNQFTGPVPAQLASLVNLQELYLTENQLTGPIPTELGNLTKLRRLSLSDNQLTGPIPAELGNLANLTYLSLSINQLTGTIPAELGSLSKLTYLGLRSNQLSGPLPQTLTALTALEQFYFYNNLGLCAPVDNAFQTWLRGIGAVFGSSCAPVDSQEDRAVLETLYNSTGGADWTNKANWLSDRPIREWYGVTTDANGRVNGLYLWENQLTGPIPAGLGRLTNLTALHLSGNQLTGCVPAGLQDVEGNDFDLLGLSFCQTGDPLIARYDVNRNGMIEKSEVIKAINDYLFGTGPDAPSKADVIRLINLYLFGPAPAPAAQPSGATHGN